MPEQEPLAMLSKQLVFCPRGALRRKMIQLPVGHLPVDGYVFGFLPSPAFSICLFIEGRTPGGNNSM